MQALNNYSGAVILVSHDPHLVDSIADRLWLVADGTCVPFEDDLEAYRKLVVSQRKREREGAKAEARAKKQGKKGGGNSPEKQAEKLETQIATLTAQKDELENQLATASAQGNVSALKGLNQSYNKIVEELAAAEKALEAMIAGL